MTEGSSLYNCGRPYCRLSEHMDALKAKLEIMYVASGGRKVDILSHSMGGLLVKSFLALHHEVPFLFPTAIKSISLYRGSLHLRLCRHLLPVHLLASEVSTQFLEPLSDLGPQTLYGLVKLLSLPPNALT